MSLFGRPAGAPSLFGNTTNASSNPFGQSTTTTTTQQQQPAPSLGLFGQTATAPNNQTQQQQQHQHQQQQQQQHQQQQQPAPSLGLSFLGQSQSSPAATLQLQGGVTYSDKIVQQRLTSVIDKWNPQHPDCVFKHYFYNKVDEAIVPFFHPGPNDNPKEWEEALQNKPAPGMMPVLASGFTAIADRLKTQRNVISIYNQRLHEINNCLDAILSKHDLDWSVKMIEARRKHEVLRRRTLVIARKVQVLRNRGYALSGDEDELRQKLESMERAVQDPAVNARLDELWSRLIFLREQAQFLKDELAKKGLSEDSGLDGEVEAKVKKIVEDYEKQLQHLRKECELMKKDFDDYENSHPSLKAKQAV